MGRRSCGVQLNQSELVAENAIQDLRSLLLTAGNVPDMRRIGQDQLEIPIAETVQDGLPIDPVASIATARICEPRRKVQKARRRGLKRPTFSPYLAVRDLVSTGDNNRLMNIKTTDALKHYVRVILANVSAAGVGTSPTESSTKQAAGA